MVAGCVVSILYEDIRFICGKVSVILSVLPAHQPFFAQNTMSVPGSESQYQLPQLTGGDYVTQLRAKNLNSPCLCSLPLWNDPLEWLYASAVWFSVNKQKQHNRWAFLVAIIWTLCVKMAQEIQVLLYWWGIQFIHSNCMVWSSKDTSSTNTRFPQLSNVLDVKLNTDTHWFEVMPLLMWFCALSGALLLSLTSPSCL